MVQTMTSRLSKTPGRSGRLRRRAGIWRVSLVSVVAACHLGAGRPPADATRRPVDGDDALTIPWSTRFRCRGRGRFCSRSGAAAPDSGCHARASSVGARCIDNQSFGSSLLVAAGIDILLDGLVVGLGFTVAAKEGWMITVALALELVSLGLALGATLAPFGRAQSGGIGATAMSFAGFVLFLVVGMAG